MGCQCKHSSRDIAEGTRNIMELRSLFVKRMTVDSPHTDRRRKDYNQAIFHFKDEQTVEGGNGTHEQIGQPTDNDDTYPCWTPMDMSMVLRCFDNAVKDWRRAWCDDENCRRK